MLEIRATSDRDLDLIKNLYLREVEEHNEHAAEFAEDLICRFKTLLALQNNELVGLLSWDTRGGYEDGVIELVTIGVNESSKRQGIATKLVESLIDNASEFYTNKGHKLRVIILFMERQNDVAREFYTKLGFSEEAVLRQLYPHDDGVVWTRHL
ncbi:GNAT family N-acetyltransferase [Candidatus Thorarchaeota archaeon]|nr:MAG: GNAT family N-acetyltransferase [Candidatus Thorarchaeota archaeon]